MSVERNELTWYTRNEITAIWFPIIANNYHNHKLHHEIKLSFFAFASNKRKSRTLWMLSNPGNYIKNSFNFVPFYVIFKVCFLSSWTEKHTGCLTAFSRNKDNYHCIITSYIDQTISHVAKANNTWSVHVKNMI